jgi:hypothetical protein
MNAWDHLPNAAHIDRVIASATAYPELWEQVRALAWDSLKWDKVWGQAWHQAWHQVMAQGRDKVWDQSWYLARDQAWGQARGGILALIAYDDSAKYLDLPLDQLEMLYLLNEHPTCILLQPAVFVFEKERELA